MVAVGTLNVDLIIIGSAPREMEALTQWVAPSEIEIAAAGSVGYCAVDLARLGLKVAMLSSVADDPFGEVIIKQLQAEGVNTDAVEVEPDTISGLGVYMLLFGSKKRPLTGRLATHAPWPTNLSEPAEEMLKAGRLLHCGGYLHYPQMWGEPTEKLFQKAKALGLITSLDTQFPFAPVEGPWRECFGNLLQAVDLIFCDENEAENITGKKSPEDAARELLAAGPRLAVVKMGEQGALLAVKDKLVRQPPFPMAKITDAIGAGDAFDAGVIYGSLHSWNLEQTARFASATAALTLAGLGGAQTAPTLSEVQALLNQH